MAAGSEFDGQVAIVVGGGAGIGREYCVALAREGASVLVAERGESAAMTASDIKAEGLSAEVCVADIREGERIFDAAMNAFGRVDILRALPLRKVSFRPPSMERSRRAETPRVISVQRAARVAALSMVV